MGMAPRLGGGANSRLYGGGTRSIPQTRPLRTGFIVATTHDRRAGGARGRLRPGGNRVFRTKTGKKKNPGPATTDPGSICGWQSRDRETCQTGPRISARVRRLASRCIKLQPI